MISDSEPARRASGAVRTYTAWLRALPDEELAALFATRPDLMHPVPADLSALAARAISKPAVTRVLDRLDRFTLQVLEGIVALSDERPDGPPGVRPDRLATALEAPPPLLDTALFGLRGSALVWEDDGWLCPVTVLRDLLPEPAGLGPSLRSLLAGLSADRVHRLARGLGVVGHTTDPDPAGRVAAAVVAPDRLPGLLNSAGAEARAVLERLAWGPPHGTVSGAYRDVDLATLAARSSPIDGLLATGLLVATGESTVTLPREVALHLRGGRLFQRLESTAPALRGRERAPDHVDRAAAGQAFTVVRAVEELLDAWAEDPPGVLRNGGLGLRDLRHAARLLDTDEPTVAVLVETAHTAGLLAASDEVDGEWLPTAEFDAWRKESPARRWLRLVEGWLYSTRVPSLAGTRDNRGRARPVLGDGLDRASAPDIRIDALRALTEAPEGLAPDHDSVAEYLAWLRPRRSSPAGAQVLQATLRESGLLGLTGQDALATHGRELYLEATGAGGGGAGRTEPGSRAVSALADRMPEPVDQILVQGDLTAVAPGPLVPGLARDLKLAADVESTGGATVYRFTAGSVRRALDSGYGAGDLLSLLERHSGTPIPQALRYLIDDVARRHGRLRVGTASSYLRCDDPVVLDELTSDRRASGLGLSRLAPTVVASPIARSTLLERLGELGYHPVPEAGDGSVQLRRPEVRRAEARPGSGPVTEPPPAGPELRAAAVRAVRAGDEAATAVRRPVSAPGTEPPRSPTAATLRALHAAVTSGERVWIGYLDSEGRASSRIVEPARVDGGYLTAYDATQATVRRFAIHRITGVAATDSPADVEPGD